MVTSQQIYILVVTNVKKLDTFAIAFVFGYFLFYIAYYIDSWIVVCVPFISSIEGLKMYYEEMDLVPLQAPANDSYMCLNMGLLCVQLTASFTNPVEMEMSADVLPSLFWCTYYLYKITGFILLFLVLYSVSTNLVKPATLLVGERKRDKVMFCVSILCCFNIGIGLASMTYYRESAVDINAKDATKLMLSRFPASYGISYYVMITVLLLYLFTVKSSFFSLYLKPKEKHKTAPV